MVTFRVIEGAIIMYLIFIIALFIVGILTALQISYFSFNELFFESIIINLISDAIMLITTIFILERLIRDHYEKLEVSSEKIIYLNTLNNRHALLVAQLEKTFVHFITKVPEPLDVEKLFLSLNEIVKEDFISSKYKIMKLKQDSIFEYTEHVVSYQHFCKYYFKDKIEELIENYLGRYIAIIPGEVLASLFKIENQLKSNMLVVPEDFGLQLDVSHADFNPEDFRVVLTTIGEEIVKLKAYTINQ